MCTLTGGFDDNAPLDSAERYDHVHDKWSLVAPMSRPRGGVGVAALGGKIYAVGGHDGSSYLCTVECYDPTTDSWCRAGSIASYRAGAGVAFCDVYIGSVVDSLNATTASKPTMSSSCMNTSI